ncbi:hypothetical protein N7490_009557 [Penicillium lividum]|nr:hypothetical protein N7490_009557 [Penicillium lividum]
MDSKKLARHSRIEAWGIICTPFLFFAKNDFKVILYPQTQTAVGLFQTLTGPLLTNNANPVLGITLARLALIAFWNWFDLLTFNLANQQLPSSILEDSLNKPWRPIAFKRTNPDEARRLLLVLLPVGIGISSLIGGFREIIAMIILTWMYNDFGGADEDYIPRNVINTAGFICHGSGSTAIAAGYGEWELNTNDIEGDTARGRRTFPIIYGDRVARLSVAVGGMSWSVVFPRIWCLDAFGYLILLCKITPSVPSKSNLQLIRRQN